MTHTLIWESKRMRLRRERERVNVCKCLLPHWLQGGGDDGGGICEPQFNVTPSVDAQWSRVGSGLQTRLVTRGKVCALWRPSAKRVMIQNKWLNYVGLNNSALCAGKYSSVTLKHVHVEVLI